MQEEHNKQLDELRQAGHQTLTVVVEEYKDLLKSTVLHQQEDWNRQLSERLKEESERFTDILQEQVYIYRQSYLSALVVFNLLNELGKRDQM